MVWLCVWVGGRQQVDGQLYCPASPLPPGAARDAPAAQSSDKLKTSGEGITNDSLTCWKKIENLKS
ncbi:Protein of unknown function [Gryllus bimaculatus]|nr:Protein of unknown function [Gryllus bimaculatus]